MSWFARNRLWLLFAVVVLTALGAVGTVVVGVLATLSALLTGGSLLATVGTFVFVTLGLVGLNIVSAAVLLRTLANRARFPTSQRAATVCHRLEAALPPLAALGLGDRFEPSVEQQRARLADRYVDGDLSERELEAKLDALLDDDIERPSHAEPVSEPTGTVADIDRETETEH